MRKAAEIGESCLKSHKDAVFFSLVAQSRLKPHDVAYITSAWGRRFFLIVTRGYQELNLYFIKSVDLIEEIKNSR